MVIRTETIFTILQNDIRQFDIRESGANIKNLKKYISGGTHTINDNNASEFDWPIIVREINDDVNIIFDSILTINHPKMRFVFDSNGDSPHNIKINGDRAKIYISDTVSGYKGLFNCTVQKILLNSYNI